MIKKLTKYFLIISITVIFLFGLKMVLSSNSDYENTKNIINNYIE